MRTDDSAPFHADDETYYFCSNACRWSFQQAPGEYAHGQPSGDGDHAHRRE